MLRIAHPPTYLPERHYTYDVLFGRLLGVPHQAVCHDQPNTTITLLGDASAQELLVVEGLFGTPEDDWLTPASLPDLPLPRGKVHGLGLSPPLVPGELHGIYGRPVVNGGSWYETSNGRLTLALDVFGGAFFMLTRYEEAVLAERDRHGRFPATASVAFREGFLDRPIVDEYVEVLWASLTHLWPGLASHRQLRQYRVHVSHDVDWPIVTLGQHVRPLLRSTAGDLVRRREPSLAMTRLSAWARVRRGDFDRDPGNTFAWMMDASERHGLTSAFYFMADHTAGLIDGVYDLEHPWLRRLLGSIHARGHEIGLHPSYNTYRDVNQTHHELTRLRRVCEEEGIHQTAWGGRQHYLRWENPTTWQIWEDIGMAYDSTLTFADRAGFRCGTCRQYPVFNLGTRSRLQLEERPLVVMEATLFDDGSPPPMLDAALRTIVDLQQRCRLHRGDFALLWHNSSLISQRTRRLYEDVISVVAS